MFPFQGMNPEQWAKLAEEDPETLAELGRLFQALPPEQISRMQTAVHNAMAGFDVTAEMLEIERSFPAELREKLVKLASAAAISAASPHFPGSSQASPFGASLASGETDVGIPEVLHEPVREGLKSVSSSGTSDLPKDVKQARMTVLLALRESKLTCEEAYSALFGAES